MKQLNEFNDIFDLLSKSDTAVIILSRQPSFDAVASALALYLSLTKTGKDVQVVSDSAMTVGYSHLVGVDKVALEAAGGNLVISFPYRENAVDNVSYNIENKNFNLVVKPKSGTAPLKAEEVSFSYSGGLNLIITFGVANLAELGSIYQKEKESFAQGQIINIDNQENNARFGRINLVNSEASSISELMTAFLSAGRLPLDEDIANNLFLGLSETTVGFSALETTPEAFEAAALCLRHGAKQKKTEPVNKSKNKAAEELIDQGNFIPMRPMSQKDSAQRSPDKSPADNSEEDGASQNNYPPPADWLKPKVFRGTNQA